MSTNLFYESVLKSSLADQYDYLNSMLKPAIDIIKTTAISQRLGASRFGGSPDLPIACEWPKYNDKPYKFLGQINFSEIEMDNTELPQNGLLSLFVVENTDEEYLLEPFEDGFVFAIYNSDLSTLKLKQNPLGISGNSMTLEFCPTNTLPFDEYQAEGWPFDDGQYEAYEKLRSSLHKSRDYLLGYPSHCTLAYNPTPGPDWVSLLTITSDSRLDWGWHDGDNLMIFIEKQKLKNLDFGLLKADAG